MATIQQASSLPTVLFALQEPSPLPDATELKAPIVYISYSRETSQANDIIVFASWLSQFGLEVLLDQWESLKMASDVAGWVERSMEKADKIVIILSHDYHKQW